jgi:Na+-transporting NADH:ubiquinone oxidoreductase subunit NqrB
MLFKRILTYRLALYYLAAIWTGAFALSFFDLVHQSPLNMAVSTALALCVCYAVNWAFAYVFGATSNWESVGISGLIISLIITPPALDDYAAMGFLAVVAAWAMASKYLIAIKHKHLFNPACFGAAVLGTLLHRTVSWWIGDAAILLPLIVLGGLLLVHRLRYFEMVAAYAVVVLSISIAHGNTSSLTGIYNSFSNMGIHSMFGFFGLVILTEPRTAPLGTWRQLVYGALVGLLFSPFTHIGNYYFTPEAALVCGNLFTFFSNKRRVNRWMEKLGLKTATAGGRA